MEFPIKISLLFVYSLVMKMSFAFLSTVHSSLGKISPEVIKSFNQALASMYSRKVHSSLGKISPEVIKSFNQVLASMYSRKILQNIVHIL